MGNAHSEYLGSLSEMGILGLLSFLAILIAIYYTGIRCYYNFSSNDRKNKVFVMGILFALTTYFSHAFLNNYLDTDKAAVPIWGMCAMLIVWSLGLDESLSSSNPE
jgi:O-antigen ligase